MAALAVCNTRCGGKVVVDGDFYPENRCGADADCGQAHARPEDAERVRSAGYQDILFMSPEDYEASPRKEATVGCVNGFVIKNEDSGGCGIAICKPFPLQFEYGAKKRPEWVERMKLGTFEQDQNTATDKLEVYWGRLGFARLLDTPYWAMNLGYVRPTRADLGLE